MRSQNFGFEGIICHEFGYLGAEIFLYAFNFFILFFVWCLFLFLIKKMKIIRFHQEKFLDSLKRKTMIWDWIDEKTKCHNHEVVDTRYIADEVYDVVGNSLVVDAILVKNENVFEYICGVFYVWKSLNICNFIQYEKHPVIC